MRDLAGRQVMLALYVQLWVNHQDVMLTDGGLADQWVAPAAKRLAVVKGGFDGFENPLFALLAGELEGFCLQEFSHGGMGYVTRQLQSPHCRAGVRDGQLSGLTCALYILQQ